MNNYPQNPYGYAQQQMPSQPVMNRWVMEASSVEYARNYPVGLGNVVTFKIENQPIVCIKTQGFSQLEAPVFEIYDMIKREEVKKEEDNYVTKDYMASIVEKLASDMDSLKTSVLSLQNNRNKQNYPQRNNDSKSEVANNAKP